MSKSLAILAFETLFTKLKGSKPLSLDSIDSALEGNSIGYPEKAAVFVTWNKKGDLRGCIGTFSPLPIEDVITQYAIISAFEDTRFDPIREKELKDLSVSVTILSNFIPISDPLDWVTGTHGLKVLFVAGHRQYLGTFLPQVAEEQNWNQVTTLWNLLRKAGYRGPSAQETVEFYNKLLASGSMILTRYDGNKVGASYKEYMTFLEKICEA